jgi:hypothetical protein
MQCIFWSFAGLITGVLPQLIFDIGHRFFQIGMFVVWVAYRIAKTFGLFGGVDISVSMKSTATSMMTYFNSFVSWEITWPSIGYGILILLFGARLFSRHWRQRRHQILVLYVLILVLAYSIHGSPSEAYFPALFVPLAMIVGVSASWLPKKLRAMVGVFILALALYNSWFLISHDFLLYTHRTAGSVRNTYYGLPLVSMREIVSIMLKESGGRPIHLVASSDGPQPESLLDPYRFLIQEMGGVIDTAGYPITIFWGSQAVKPPVFKLRIVRIQGVVLGFPVETL